MFSIFKKRSSLPPDLSWIGTDMHSHLIPGIDDGAPDITVSMEMIRGMKELGYRKLITTPHILWEVYPNTEEQIKAEIEPLRQAAAAEGIAVELEAAAEYFIDDYFSRKLQSKAPLLPLSGNMVLVEYSMVTPPLELQEVLFEMQVQNYQPVIAHPERYTYLARKKSFFDDLKNAGCYFQLNLLSLTGYYGDAVLHLAEYLVKQNYYDLAGSDLHSPRHLDAMQKLGSSSLLNRLKESGTLKNHLL
ncbi:MAG TPA: CpsB/CapC family capsule biosynthesis tyrosine phosphatase [Flavisolibacter sp.]